jgi:hypothetical protein
MYIVKRGVEARVNGTVTFCALVQGRQYYQNHDTCRDRDRDHEDNGKSGSGWTFGAPLNPFHNLE